MDRAPVADPLSVIEQITHVERDPRLRVVRYQPQGIAIQHPMPGAAMGSPFCRQCFSRICRGIVPWFAVVWAARRAKPRRVGNQKNRLRTCAERSARLRRSPWPGCRKDSEHDSNLDLSETDDEPDFTRQPLSFRDWVKLTWMRFSGSAV